MAAWRVGPLPARALDAAAAFHANVLPKLEAMLGLNPPRYGEGDRDAQRRGGGGPPAGAALSAAPLHQPAAGSPPRPREDLVLIFLPAPSDHRGWRLAAVQDLARAAAPARVNGVVGDDEAAVAHTLIYLENAPGITGQVLVAEN